MNTKLSLLAISIATMISTGIAQAGSVKTDGQDLIIKTKSGLKIETEDKTTSFQLGGRIQWDYDGTDSDNTAKSVQELDVRRARIFVKGHNKDWGYKAQFNIAESDGSKGGNAEDLYIRYTGFGKMAHITVGKQKESFGLEELTSSKDISALERSAMTEQYSPGRSAGVQLSGKGNNWTYGVGIFEADGNASDDVNRVALTGRATFAPVNNGENLVHLGTAYSKRGQSNTVGIDKYNIELAAASGPFHAQAEYFNSKEGDSASINGFYVQVGWVLTGESRPYSGGVFKRVQASTPSGAWELIARYEDGDGKYSDIGLATTDGKQSTLGLNYYANDNVRVGLSYMDGEESQSNLSGNELRARMQYVF
tara:strand:- start:122711 stop:123808 length:1098 start_codon:yes stop_codon:yes gene_type:complete